MLVGSRTMETPLRCWSDTQRCRVRVPGTRRRGTYGDKAKPSVAPHFRRLCCESANGTPLPAAVVCRSFAQARDDDTCCLMGTRRIERIEYRHNLLAIFWREVRLP